MEKLKFAISCLFLISGTPFVKAQTITGVWTGKINRQKVEVRIILKDAHLTGTTSYYQSPSIYARYSIKGYFNSGTNELVWCDDQLLEEKGHGSPGGKKPTLSSSDFSCPGYGRLTLGGEASYVNKQYQPPGEMGPGNTDWSDFTDEWDFVLETFTETDNDPEIVDSIDLVAAIKAIQDREAKLFSEGDSVISIAEPTAPQIESTKSTHPVMPDDSIKPSAIEESYVARKKVFAAQIPVSGDSVELHFYDNGQVDGDSISLFLNNKLIFEHIRLTDKAYSIKLSVSDLNSTNELVMVAENLGSIPPNTSFMVAIVADKRYEARLESTEGGSAVVRLVKTMDERIGNRQ